MLKGIQSTYPSNKAIVYLKNMLMDKAYLEGSFLYSLLKLLDAS